MLSSHEFDSPFPGDNDIKLLAQKALDAAQGISDPNRTPEDIGIEPID